MTDPTVRRLRVALDATPLLEPRTGVGEFCARAMGALAGRSDMSIAAFAVSWRRRHGLRSELPLGISLLDRPMPARPLHKSWSLWPFPPVELFIGSVDVVHGTNFVVPPAWRAATVVTVHDLTAVHFPELCQPATLAYPLLVEKAVKRGAWVHTPSEFVRQEVMELLGVPPERVRAVHHGVPGSPAGAAANAGASVPLVLPGWVERYVLAVGKVEPRKDLPTLVRAFGTFARAEPKLALVIAGPPGWGEAQFDAAVAECPARDQVLRLGWVDDTTRDALVAGATVLAYPSLYEGFGFPPLQAMSVGTPVVATRCGALPEILGDAACLVEVGDVEALAGALRGLVSNDAARRELSERGRQRASTYSWEACAAGLAGLYRDAVAYM